MTTRLDAFMFEAQQNRHEEEDSSQVNTGHLIHIPAGGGNAQNRCLPIASKVQDEKGERG